MEVSCISGDNGMPCFGSALLLRKWFGHEQLWDVIGFCLKSMVEVLGHTMAFSISNLCYPISTN